MEQDPSAERPGALFAKAVGGLPDPERDRLIAYLFEATTGAGWAVSSPSADSPSERAYTGSLREVLMDVARLLAKGFTIDDIAAELGVPDEFVRSLLPRLPEIVRPRSQVESDALDLFAQGLRRRQVAGRLKMKETDLSKVVLAAVGRENLRHKLSSPGGLAGAVTPHFFAPPSAPSRRTEYQMVPVRLAEAQHRRLKIWCEEHDFSMAVVMRGLVERFLAEQEKRVP